MLADAVGNVAVHDDPDLLLMIQASVVATLKLAVYVTGADVDWNAVAAYPAAVPNAVPPNLLTVIAPVLAIVASPDIDPGA